MTKPRKQNEERLIQLSSIPPPSPPPPPHSLLRLSFGAVAPSPPLTLQPRKKLSTANGGEKSLMVEGKEANVATNRKVRTRRKTSRSPGKGSTPSGSTPSNTSEGGKERVSGPRSPENLNKVAWSKKVLTLSCKTLIEEFNQKIKKFVDTRCTTICSSKNEDKNRYADVLCLDDTRVVLRGRKVEDDYIHANWVKNPDGSRMICTQGPLTETIEDFWLMVVREKVTIILMLCQFMEGEDNEKCARYFPTTVDESMTCGPYKVKNLDTLRQPEIEGCVCSNLEVVYDKNKKHRVRHVLMSSWPDQCAPLVTTQVLELYKWVKKETKGSDDPIVVHCSAGVGRTATFAAIEIAAYRIGKNANVSMMEVVKDMRTMRYQAVQSYVQYLFLHLLMLDLFCSEKIIDKYDSDGKFIKEYKRLATRKISKMAKKEAEMGKKSKMSDGRKKISMQNDDAE